MGVIRLAAVVVGINLLLFALVVSAMAAAGALPSTGQLAYIGVGPRGGGGHVYLLDIDRHFRHRLLRVPSGVSRIVWSPSRDRIAFVVALGEESSRLVITGPGGRGSKVIGSSGGYNDFPDWSPDGRRLAFISTGRGEFPNLHIVNADGSGQQMLSELIASWQPPAWSPDGSRIAFVADGIHLIDPASGSIVNRVTAFSGGYNNLAWSPGGRALAFTVLDERLAGLYTVDADSGSLRRLTPDNVDVLRGVTWSPDGRQVAFMAFYEDNADIYVADPACGYTLDGAASQGDDRCRLRRMTDHAAVDWLPAWSGDGNWLSFVSYRNRVSQLFVMQPDGSTLVSVVGQGVGDFQPVWLP